MPGRTAWAFLIAGWLLALGIRLAIEDIPTPVDGVSYVLLWATTLALIALAANRLLVCLRSWLTTKQQGEPLVTARAIRWSLVLVMVGALLYRGIAKPDGLDAQIAFFALLVAALVWVILKVRETRIETLRR